MKIDMLMPQMGESITTATISRWLKSAGDAVEKDEIILEITTDKVDSEIPAPASGVLSEVLFAEGDEVPVKSKIAIIDSAASPEAAPQVEEPKQEQKVEVLQAEVSTNAASSSKETSNSSRFYSPLVKSLAAKHNVNLSDLDALPGTGKGGRFTKEDFLTHIEGSTPAKASSVNAPAAPTQTKAATPPPAAKPAAAKPTATAKTESKNLPINEWLPDGSKRVPMSGMRKAIAHHMVMSKQTSPHVYTIQETDVSKVAKWRQQNKAEFRKREGFNLSFTPFFLEAAIKALQEFPIVNASIQDNMIVYKKDVNLGCAVSLPNDGLIVPVIKKSDEKNLVGLARSLNDLALRARDKKLLPDEVMNGSFTVTNPGIFGTMIGTPIINQPQSAILCLGAIEKRPVVIDDMIAIKERCYLTLSYDHRIIDGSTSARFLAFICNYLADWDMDRGLF